MLKKNMVDLIANLLKAKEEYRHRQYEIIATETLESYEKLLENIKNLSENDRKQTILAFIVNVAQSNYMMGKKDAIEYGE
jgi:hypothetical protein